ncbi:response regulator [Planktosalinus lacus]|uniref:Two-component system response regulator n=1 Tax=Planktosalinus lacus TaxID=1526573 RepID=A0A8J2V8P0_9FLAO|nr:response regulator [Planktosalinus lacus]GGD83356.1 two-component system response regulator [Planktosalinus lacus]
MEKKPLHILLADDDESDRLLFMDAFAELKINTIVNTVNDGAQLMEWLNKESNRLPHLIFLDLNMPRKDGMECLKEIKRNEKLKDISIAIYSTSDNEKDIEETFRNGANVYITKPNSFNKLKKVLEKAVVTAYQYEDQSMIRQNFLLRI